MCGITGWFTRVAQAEREVQHTARHMCDIIAHRGPDDSAIWMDASGRVLLGHRRLSVLDLSAEGRQPMRSQSGRYSIVYNGEVYNHLSLRNEIGDRPWRGHSDTETILAAIERWGLEQAVSKFIGMFAFALWDREEEALWLVRDRLGIKPLYFGFWPGGLIFGSELGTFEAHPSFPCNVNRDAIHLLLRYNSIPAPFTIYDNAFKVEPGTALRFRAPHFEQMERKCYWSAADVALRGQADPFSGSPEAAVDQLDHLLRDAIGMRMLADVPLGAFLSGGIDSSTVVSLMQAQSSRPIRTFSIGFEEQSYDESRDAKAIAQHIGTDHSEMCVTPNDAMGVIQSLGGMFSEPFADPSQIPTFLVSKLARTSVTVALSGDGGDELFGGYNRHVWAPKMWKALAHVPQPMRAAAARSITRISPDSWDGWFARLRPVLPTAMIHTMPGYKLHKLANSVDAASPLDFYTRLASQWTNPAALVKGGTEPDIQTAGASSVHGFAAQMMLLDIVRYLPDDILTKVDRASMAVSLEARVPLLDHRVVEFAWKLPEHFKFRDAQSKWILRQVLGKYVPLEIMNRPKSGFGLPLAQWLRGPLRSWASDVLNPEKLSRDGFFNDKPIRLAWEQHIAGTHDWSHPLWTVLMFQTWLNERVRN